MDSNADIQTIIGKTLEDSFSQPETPEFRILHHLLSAFMHVQLTYDEGVINGKEFGTSSGDEWKSRVLKRVCDRMELGRSRYGHGVRISDDTRQWGTQRNSWAEMCEEEIIDGLIYISAEMLRKGNV
jgi:hypothetical protein